jgi:protein-S-isoprenylcysteine O-methyltransferase Ste14
MQALENKVPPPIVAILVAAAMWSVSAVEPSLPIPEPARQVAVFAIALVGGSFDFLGLLAFHASRTTINPLKPEKASALVTGGIYRITRNPMYVGLTFLLSAWAVQLASLWPLVGPALFVLYINRFQIEPEERVLARLFGAEYSAYAARVRRWL